MSFVAAEHDVFCPPEVIAHDQRRFRAATLDILRVASHSAYYEGPGDWN